MTAIKCYADAVRTQLRNYGTIMRMTRYTAFVAIRFEFFFSHSQIYVEEQL